MLIHRGPQKRHWNDNRCKIAQFNQLPKINISLFCRRATSYLGEMSTRKPRGATGWTDSRRHHGGYGSRSREDDLWVPPAGGESWIRQHCGPENHGRQYLGRHIDDKVNVCLKSLFWEQISSEVIFFITNYAQNLIVILIVKIDSIRNHCF